MNVRTMLAYGWLGLLGGLFVLGFVAFAVAFPPGAILLVGILLAGWVTAWAIEKTVEWEISRRRSR